MSAQKSNKVRIKLKNINELLEEPKIEDKDQVSLAQQNGSPRTRLRAKKQQETAVSKIQVESEKPIRRLRKRSKGLEKENIVKEEEIKVSMKSKKAASTTKKAKVRVRNDSSSSVEFLFETPAPKPKAKPMPKVQAKTTTRKQKKTLPANQRRIDAFFKSTTKPENNELTHEEKKQVRGRKRLFANETNKTNSKTRKKVIGNKTDNNKTETIDLCLLSSDTEEEQADLKDFDLSNSKSMIKMTKIPDMASINYLKRTQGTKKNDTKEIKSKPKKETSKLYEFKDEGTSLDSISIEHKSSTTSSETLCEKPAKPCPAYKVVKDTTFAVDAFRFGRIPGVTHYFLTHFHADHYTGLTKKFAMPIFMSALTARLVREFIGVDERMIFELPLNEPVLVENVEVTALDANHCPGAIIIVFKLKNGKCILHTGDFRAWHGMESEPVFWNNEIDTIYLDTTYLPTQYAFCTQYESIDRGKSIVEEFKKRHPHKRVLYICGSYVIGKEKFWSSIAQEFRFKVWAEANRRKALKAMQLSELENISFVEDPEDADLHIIPLGKLVYPELYEYFQKFAKTFDLMLALRPSGWEKNSRPRFSAQINVVGVEYSEHSSYNELERFVKFLKPREVISTVPVGHNLFDTADVPNRWYEYDDLTPQTRSHQPSITNFLKIKPNQSKLGKTSFIEKDKHDFYKHKLSTTQSTALACMGSIPPPDFDADALDDWLN